MKNIKSYESYFQEELPAKTLGDVAAVHPDELKSEEELDSEESEINELEELEREINQGSGAPPLVSESTHVTTKFFEYQWKDSSVK